VTRFLKCIISMQFLSETPKPPTFRLTRGTKLWNTLHVKNPSRARCQDTGDGSGNQLLCASTFSVQVGLYSHLARLRFLVVSTVTPHTCQDNSSIRPRPLPHHFQFNYPTIRRYVVGQHAVTSTHMRGNENVSASPLTSLGICSRVRYVVRNVGISPKNT
jgi:hypothetical protein